MGKSLSMIIPAYNEAANIKATLDEMMAACSAFDMNFEIIVVNDNSKDETRKIVEKYAESSPQVRLLNNDQNLGFGGAYWRGVRSARMETCMMMVADDAIGRESTMNIIRLKDQAPLVIPYIANPAERDWIRRVLSYGYVKILNFIFRLNLRYYNGHNIVETRLLQGMPNTSGFAYAAQYVIRLLKRGYPYVETPMVIKNRVQGSTKAFKVKNILSVLKTISLLIKEVYLDGIDAPAKTESESVKR